MKKILTITLALLLCFGFTSCGNSPNPMTEIKTEDSDILNDSGDPIGHFVYIEMDKADLKDVTEKQFQEFVDTVVSRKDYNWYSWFSIFCNDGTGICFDGGNVEAVSYGKISNQGDILKKIGTITLKDGKYTFEESV